MAGPMAIASAAAFAEESIPVTMNISQSGPMFSGESGDSYLNAVIAERYRILHKIGEGGMGTVYLAEHIIIEKRVALKILSEDFARKADLVQRFIQEAKAASRIGHENIVDITDFGETPSGSVFIAMEFLEGSDLANVIRKQGAVPFERARYIVSQICRALAAAHAKGIIHRDIKPENVYLIEREGRGDFVKILDFGIAKVNSLDDGAARLTRTGMIFGTPEYMSPEQARGDRPDHRVDIYAVGCILYELLTGDVPFHADTFMGVLTKHMFEQPQPPSVRAPDRHIPPEVEAVVLRAISKDRDQRFQTMKEFALALAACGGGDGEVWNNDGLDGTPPPLLSGSDVAVSYGGGPSGPSGSTAATPGGSTRSMPPIATRSRALPIAAVMALIVGGGFLAARTFGGRGAAPPIAIDPPPTPGPIVITPTPAPTVPTVQPAPTPVPAPPLPTTAIVALRSTPAGPTSTAATRGWAPRPTR